MGVYHSLCRQMQPGVQLWALGSPAAPCEGPSGPQGLLCYGVAQQQKAGRDGHPMSHAHVCLCPLIWASLYLGDPERSNTLW